MVHAVQRSVRYLEDYHPGEIINLGNYDVTREEIVQFARKYDPHPFHLDEEASGSLFFGGIISSGWLTALIWLRLMHQSFISPETSLGSPGHEEMNWKRPVRPGDRLQGRAEVKEVRVSKSRPELGFVRYTATLTNQNDEPVFVTTSSLIVKTKAASKTR
jgi:acyl dehydratase